MPTATARKSTTKKAPAKKATAKKATAKKAAAKPEPPQEQTTLVWLPGKEARPERGTRAATEAVPPTVLGDLAHLEEFLDGRFKWVVQDDVDGKVVLYAATYDVEPGTPGSAEDAANRATHVSQGQDLEAAKRAMVTAIIATERPLQITYAKPVVHRPPNPEDELLHTPIEEDPTPAKAAAKKATASR